MPVRQLSEVTINRIAAGEVVERPASVVKELVENALDAGAARIEIVTAGGGKTLIRVTDDGSGMTREDLDLAVERHCTSKLADDDLLTIETLGFRGEALPSIGAIARLAIATRHASEPHGWEIAIEGGDKIEPRPAALSRGTRVEVRDLFFATPARLKFLKTERAEAAAITEIVKRLALSRPDVRFSLAGADRSALELSAQTGDDAWIARIAAVIGADFAENSVPVDAEREGVRLVGHVGLPTFHRAASTQQYLMVNGRPVRDKLLMGAIRGAYADVMAGDRHPVLVLDLRLDPHEVDVNVHPTKADVRFREGGLVRGLLVGAIREALARAGHRSSTTGGSATLAALRPGLGGAQGAAWQGAGWRPGSWAGAAPAGGQAGPPDRPWRRAPASASIPAVPRPGTTPCRPRATSASTGAPRRSARRTARAERPGARPISRPMTQPSTRTASRRSCRRRQRSPSPCWQSPRATRAATRHRSTRSACTGRSARRARSSMPITSCRRPRTGSSSSMPMPRMSGSITSG
ncbi:DNA mismatch repair endonuclease MutL [Methyloraptor flagellatus]|uniref:DNA mismatch repair protein MutL n=1 Tax=Methyloraptor flagellatus TaxID=3162530 RepID=A0AAU7X6G6_9HYPH